jgi:hypothetical protein
LAGNLRQRMQDPEMLRMMKVSGVAVLLGPPLLP